MIQILFFDLEETLLHSGLPFPHVLSALEDIGDFVTEQGTPVVLAVVSNTGAPTISQPDLEHAERQFADVLRAAEIDRFFSPFEARATISARAKVSKPNRPFFELAIQRAKANTPFSDCLFISATESELSAARSLGLQTLGYGKSSLNSLSFSEWRQAPPMIAEMVAPQNKHNLQRAYSRILKQDYGIEAFTFLWRHGATVGGQGTRLVQLTRPELGVQDGVYVEVPTDISIRIGPGGIVEHVTIGDLPDEDIDEAVAHVQRLARNGQISIDPDSPSKGATHAIETDGEGRRVLIRQRYSS